MSVVHFERHLPNDVDLARLAKDVTESDQRIYKQITSTELTEEQRRRILEVPRVYKKQRYVLAIHWHPEFVPLELIKQRVAKMFPNCEDHLIIPTQHNVLMSYDDSTGVEVDCYSPQFQRKVQLLVHFANERVDAQGDVFKAMLAHTFRYRLSQLNEFIASLIEPRYEDRVNRAATETGATEDLVEFVRIHVRRIQKLIERNESTTAPEMLRNKLLSNYFDVLRFEYDDRLITHVQVFLKAVKEIVKSRFALDYFYQTEQIIEEVRGLGGCIVVPHPEQFWPILLEDLDVDGIEVWNPQSFEYTEFLINVVNRQNRTLRAGRPMLVTMGDDCHMGEKVKEPSHQDRQKASREIGVQPPWDDLSIRKSLIVANASRRNVIDEYRNRLLP